MLRHRVIAATLPLAAAVATVSGCVSSGDARVTALSSASVARWAPAWHVGGVVDLTDPRRRGGVVFAAAGRLGVLSLPGGQLKPFATGPGGYLSPSGGEPYVALSAGQSVAGARCAFPLNAVYALRLANGPGVDVVDTRGRSRRFAALPANGLENGIAFDAVGRFGHRLLVTETAGSVTSVYALDCRGRVTTITRDAPRVEGGIAVAPSTFGRFAGDLIAPDEISGRVFAISPHGGAHLVAASGLPQGGDVGVESIGFAPPRLGPRVIALVADRLTPGNPHPGDDAVLRLSGAALAAAGVRSGDLLVATEGGARTDAISCAKTCRVRHVADGPDVAHVEGHIVFAPGR